jgi:GT2 family glycosyltransferase
MGDGDGPGSKSATPREAPGADPQSRAIGVVVVSWNVRDLLRRCLASLAGQWPDLRIVVVDNASADGSVAMVRGEFPGVHVLANEANLGFTRASNQGLRFLDIDEGRAAGPKAVLLLNPDAEVLPGAMAAMQSALWASDRVGAVGPLLRYPGGAVQSSRRRFPTVLTGMLESTPLAWFWPNNPVARRYRLDDVPADRPSAVDWLTGAALLLRSRALADVGLFDERFFMYSEELDLCRRLCDAGWGVVFEPRAEVVHHEARSSDQVAGARHLLFHRSRVRYFRKHHGGPAAAVVLAATLAQYAAAVLVESAKWALGHKRPLRRERVTAYRALLWGLLRP